MTVSVEPSRLAARETCLAQQGLSGDNFKFTHIIVSKRIKTRFFKKDAKGPSNSPSGSIMVDVVTLPEREVKVNILIFSSLPCFRYDFFLI